MLIEAIDDLLRGGKADPPRRRRAEVNGVTVALARIGDELVAVIKGSFAPSFSWGRPEYPIAEVVGELMGLTLYADESPYYDRPESWLKDDANRERLTQLRLAGGENLLVAANLIDLRGRPKDAELWGQRVDALVALSKAMTVPKRRVPGLAELVELGLDRAFLERWAVSDDVDRGEAIEAATDAELEEMLRVTAAYWPRLQPLVDGERRDDPHAVLAGLLTDAAQEVEIELDRRRGR